MCPMTDVVSSSEGAAVERTGAWSVFVVVLLLASAGCRSPSGNVQAHLEGRITVRSSVDPSGDHSGFRVLVVDAEERTIDTLAHATTGTDGRFATTVSAAERGIYTLTVWGRRGRERLATTDYVVADGDSASLEAALPLQGRRLQVRSNENSALAAYRNTLAQHRRRLVEQFRSEAYDSTALARRIRQTSSVLWNLQDTFPDTYASRLAAAESLSLLAGWNDSLVVARARSISPSNPRFVAVAEKGRRAAARLYGQSAALAFLDSAATRAATDPQRAGIQAARVRAFIDSLQKEAALAAAEDLKTSYPGTNWAEWADRATYEVNNLLPGTAAPDFAVRTLAGDSLSLSRLRGRPVVLEFFRPENSLYGRQLSTRNALYEATRSDSVAFVSVSVEPDTLLFRAFADARSVPGHRVIAAEGIEAPIATAYNVARLPTRFLIGPDGRIVGRYQGTAFLALQEDLLQLLEGPRPSNPG
jgi:peroxiredoxin